MPDKFTLMTPELHAYAVERSGEDGILARLRAETEEATDVPQMQIAPDQGAFMGILVRAIGARRALELGTFTGYSAICVARQLPADGLLVACDVSEEWTSIARRYWDEAGITDRIDLRLGPATETLAGLAAERAEPFDFAFIDADKENYPAYWEAVVELVRPGGLILVDNVFASGGVAPSEGGGPGRDPEYVATMSQFNDRVAADERVDSAMVSIADGLTVACKR